MGHLMLKLDHIAVACETLEEGRAHVEAVNAVIAAVPALIRPNRPSVGTATDPGRTTADPGCRPLDQGIALEPARPDPGRQPS